MPVYKRCKYYFELHTEKEVWYYFEDGFLTEDQLKMDGRMLQCFIVPWMGERYDLVSDLSGSIL